MRSIGIRRNGIRLVRRAALVAAMAVAAFGGHARADDAHFEKRVVLALFDSEGPHGKLDTQDPVHVQLEMPLNYLGMVVHRHDIRKGPPPPEVLARSRAVILRFHYAKTCPDWLWPWLEETLRPSGVRLVVVGNFGPLVLHDVDDLNAGGPGDRLARWLAQFGLGFNYRFEQGPLGLDVRYHDEALCKFEADPELRPVWRGPWNESEDNKPWVMVRHAVERDRDRTPVITGPWGGVALNPWVFFEGSDVADSDDAHWFINPFEFFREALGLEGVPAPDPSVLNGRRMFFLHLDGDGFESLSTVRPGKLSAEVFLKEVIEQYRLPYTMSVIIASLTDDYDVAEPTHAMRVASEILNRPDVVPASHGVLHPFYWQDPLSMHSEHHQVVGYASLRNYEYSPVAEVTESVRFINDRLLQPGRRCELMLWTGNTIPPEDAILESGRVGCLNMNGGTLRFDSATDSVAFVMGWGRVLGDAFQVYAAAPNENDYEGFFTTMPGAYGHVDAHLERTGAPRILKPANIYVHFYVAETPARLQNVHDLIRRWAIEEPTAPVPATTYIRAVNSAFLGSHIARTRSGWKMRDFGDCTTVRIDGETRHVDWRNSPGLIGARHMLGSLFLHLGAPDADVVLSDEPHPLPHVEQANHALTSVVLDTKRITFTSLSLAPRTVILAGFPGSVEVTVDLNGVKETQSTRADGRLPLDLGGPGRTRVDVRLR